MKFTKLFAAAFGCALAFSATGCSDEETVIVGPAGAGTLTLTWTVAGVPDPGACAFYGATDFELVVYDVAGVPYTSTTAPCDAFATTIDLPAGSFNADATLIDPRGDAVSVTLPIDDIRIITATDLTIDVDFPPESMLP